MYILPQWKTNFKSPKQPRENLFKIPRLEKGKQIEPKAKADWEGSQGLPTFLLYQLFEINDNRRAYWWVCVKSLAVTSTLEYKCLWNKQNGNLWPMVLLDMKLQFNLKHWVPVDLTGDSDHRTTKFKRN